MYPQWIYIDYCNVQNSYAKHLPPEPQANYSAQLVEYCSLYYKNVSCYRVFSLLHESVSLLSCNNENLFYLQEPLVIMRSSQDNENLSSNNLNFL